MDNNPELDKLLTDAVSIVDLVNKHQPSKSDMGGLIGLTVAMFYFLIPATIETVLTSRIKQTNTILLNGLAAAYALGYERGSNQDPTTKAGTELLKSLERGEHA